MGQLQFALFNWSSYSNEVTCTCREGLNVLPINVQCAHHELMAYV